LISVSIADILIVIFYSEQFNENVEFYDVNPFI